MHKIDLNGKSILVTGSPGFIGANLVIRLLRELSSGTVVSFDNMNDYYEVSLKEWRLQQIEKAAAASPVKHIFVKGSIADKTLLDQLFADYRFDIVVNLAAQAGVRYSIDHPDVYMESNIIGFYNILEACRHNPVDHLVYASSSSVYGGNKKVPFSTDDKVDHPVSLYAATKKSNELFAHALQHPLHRPQILHRLWACRKTRYVLLQRRQEACSRPDGPDFQLRGHAPRLHLHR